MLYVITYNFIYKNLNNCEDKDKYYFPIIDDKNVELDNKNIELKLKNKKILIYLKSAQNSNYTGFYGYTIINGIITMNNNRKTYNNLLDKYFLSDVYNLYFIECTII